MAARLGVLLLAVALAACDGADTTDSTNPPPIGAETAPPSSPAGVASTATTFAPPSTTPLPVDGGELGALDAALSEDGTLELEPALALFAAGYGPMPGITPAAQPVVDGALTTFGQQLGRPLSPEVRVTLLELPYDNGDGTHNFSSPQSHATALPFGDGLDVEYGECRIRVNATSTVDETDPALVSALAREAFHCLQYAVVPSARDVPLWTVEGAAGFAGEDYSGGSSASTAGWQRWVGEPQRPLERRTYDAVGFFSLLDEIADAYSFADALLIDPSSVRLRLEQTDLFDRWGVHYATEPTWGPAYSLAAPAAAALRAPQQAIELQIDGAGVVIGGSAVGTLSAAPYRFTAPGDVLVITAAPGARGGVRFADGQEIPLAQATQTFCLQPAGCTCPGVAADSLPVTQVAGAELFIGVGPSSGSGPELAARSLAQWCQEVLVPAPPADALDPCLVGTWTSRSYVAPELAGVAQTVSGGDGALVELRPDRTASVDMSRTSPVVITATAPDGTVTTTTLEYGGAGSGTWSAAGGVVDLAGVDTSSFTIRVRIEAGGRLVADDEIPLSDGRLAGYASPLGTGRYQCTAVALTITHVTPGVDGAAGFTFSP